MGGIAVGVEGSATAWESVFNLGNCAIGAGILSFPYAFWLAGILGGLCLCLVVASIEYFTLNIIARQSTIHGSITYQGLVRSGLGQIASEIMSWTILAFIFGSCVAYIIIVGDNFGAVVKDYIVHPLELPPIFAARQVMILVLGTTIMLPISLQRSMVALAPVSTVALAVMTLTTGIIVVKVGWQLITQGASEMLAPVALFHFDLAAVGAIPVMVFAYHCHVQSVPIYYELTFDPVLFDCTKMRRAAVDRQEQQQSAAVQPSTVSRSGTDVDATTENAPLLRESNGTSTLATADSAPVATTPAPLHRTAGEVRRKLFGMARVLAAGYTECTVLYLATGIAGYILFPKDAQSNILKNFPPDDHLMQIMRFLVGFAVLLHYPINQHVARSALYDLICHYSGATPQAHVPYSHVAGLTLAFFAASVGTACVVSDLGIVFQVIGGLAGSLLVFVLPGGLVVAHCRGRFTADPSDTVAQAQMHEGSSGSGAMSRTTSGDGGLPRARKSFDYIDVESQSRAGIEHRKPRARSANGAGGSEGHAVNGNIPENEEEPNGGVTCMHEAHPEVCNTAMEYEPLGWALIALGACVFMITMYITFADTLGGRRR